MVRPFVRPNYRETRPTSFILQSMFFHFVGHVNDIDVPTAQDDPHVLTIVELLLKFLR